MCLFYWLVVSEVGNRSPYLFVIWFSCLLWVCVCGLCNISWIKSISQHTFFYYLVLLFSSFTFIANSSVMLLVGVCVYIVNVCYFYAQIGSIENDLWGWDLLVCIDADAIVALHIMFSTRQNRANSIAYHTDWCVLCKCCFQHDSLHTIWVAVCTRVSGWRHVAF